VEVAAVKITALELRVDQAVEVDKIKLEEPQAQQVKATLEDQPYHPQLARVGAVVLELLGVIQAPIQVVQAAMA